MLTEEEKAIVLSVLENHISEYYRERDTEEKCMVWDAILKKLGGNGLTL